MVKGKNQSLDAETEEDAHSEVQAVAWYGKVLGLPDGNPYDDYLQLLPESNLEFGIAGADPAVEDLIESLRDKEPPGAVAHFWGNLTCGVDDYAGCEGVVFSGPEGPRSGGDDFLTLLGSYPIQYGIWAGDETLAAEIESLRDTGTPVRVWGKLLAGIPDWSGTQIQVERLEVIEAAASDIPARPTFGGEDDGWQEYSNEDLGYSFRYPQNAQITETGVIGFPQEELPDGMEPGAYIDQLTQMYGSVLCVEIRYGLGYLAIRPGEERGGAYTQCGRTGMGASEISPVSQTLSIGGVQVQAEGYETVADVDTLDYHNETLTVELENGLMLEFGAIPDAEATYEDYLMKGRPMLLQILESFSLNP